nr:integrase, catalytic region, zinc finger, CCHC-type, peptidase aspartic, catalytic [Tanacetum cinerariifolium]
MSMQQDVYAAGSESRSPMLNKENYVPWSSRLLRYAKSRPNGKLIYNSIINGSYVRRMNPEPGDTNQDVPVNETFHVQNDDELTEKELKQIEADNQAIQTIILGLPEDIYAVVDSYETAQEIWLRPEWSRHVTIVHQTKDLHTADYTQLYDILKYNQNENVGNPNRYNAVQNVRNQVVQNAVQNPRVHNIRNQNGLIGVPGNANQNLNGNGVGHFARNCTVRPRRRDAAYLQTQLLIAQKEEQASTSGTQSDKAPVYDSDGSAEVHDYENCDDNEIFNMFTQEELYTKLLEPIPEQHQVPHDDNNVIFEVTSVEQGGETVEQHPASFEETCALYDSLYHNLAIKVEKVNSVNRKLKETNADLTTEFAKFKNQEKCFEISQEKYDKPERCYQQSVYQEQCLSKKINALHLSIVDTTLSVARKFLNEVKSTIVTLQRVVKHRMTIETHNWSSFAHQELHKIVKDENFPIVNQVDARVQNFEKQFLKEATKFVGDFKSLAKEADESLAKHKALELEIERLLRAVVSQDIMSVVQKTSVVDISNLQTELERIDNTKTRRPQPRSNTKNDRVSFASKNIRSKNKGAEVEEHHRNLLLSKNKKRISSACNNFTLDSHNVYSKVVCAMCKQCLIYVNHDECLLNYVYDKNSRGNLKLLINFVWKFLGTVRFKNDHVAAILSFGDLQWGNILINRVYFVEGLGHNLFSEAAKFVGDFKSLAKEADESLAQQKALELEIERILKVVVSNQKDITHDTSANTKFVKQSIEENLSKVDESHALSKLVTSNSVSRPQEPKVVNNDKVIASGMFVIDSFTTSREEEHVPNTVRASDRTKPITDSQPSVITKKDVNSDLNGLSSTGLDNTKTRRP